MTHETTANSFDVAIIGIACRFPNATNADEFWSNLAAGRESITFHTDSDLLAAGVPPERLHHPDYVKAGTCLSDYDHFDAAFFGMSPRDAELLDPQHRLFLECAWEALEHAGYGPFSNEKRIGVFAGAGISSYLINNLLPSLNIVESIGLYQILTENDGQFLPTRTSYKLDLRGPSVHVQTACSTSLVAVHLACQSLLAGECAVAIAGGSSVQIPHVNGYLYQPGMIYSPDGHCRAFARDAQGTIGGNGVGVVALKTLTKALEDGDTIYAIIKATAINNDGARKVGFTAPSVDGQADVIREALMLSGVEPETIAYIEAHGTGTPLGDPIEIAALKQAFRTTKRGFCAIGSVKTNIGHADAAAGIAGLIKTALSLQNAKIPPSLHADLPNPAFGLSDSPFFINTTLRDWGDKNGPRRAGVSSFGVGGTNAHVIVEQAPARESSGPSRPYALMVLSAKTPTALEMVSERLAKHLQEHPDTPLSDIAFTLARGRTRHAHRRALVCQTASEAIALLGQPGAQTGTSEARNRPIVFMFPGNGSQYVGMGRGLYESESVFRAEIDRCAEFLRPLLGLDLRTLMYSEDKPEVTKKLDELMFAHAAIFVTSYANAKLWLSFGVKPCAMIGHSYGEYVAAALAGVFSLEDALTIVVERGRLMQSCADGAMLAVPLSVDELQPHLRRGSVELAAVNGPALCVVSGPVSAIEAFHAQLAATGVNCRLLHIPRAFHSSMMTPIVDEFAQRVRSVKLSPPSIPYISTTSGGFITESEVTDAAYWAQQLLQPVRWAEGIKTLAADPDVVFMEIGPGRTTSMLAKQHPDATNHVVLHSLRHYHEQHADVLTTLNVIGQLWTAGIDIDWRGFYAGERRHRVPLPTYPFERQRYFIDARQTDQRSPQKSETDTVKKMPLERWFYVPTWEQTTLPQSSKNATKRTMLVFLGDDAVGSEICARMESAGHDVITVRCGPQFQQLGPRMYALPPNHPEAYANLWQTLGQNGFFIEQIVHLWLLDSNPLDVALERGFHSLLHLARALGRIVHHVEMIVVTTNMHAVLGDEVLRPELATVLGALQVIPQEYPHLRCRNVDLAATSSGEPLMAEILRDSSGQTHPEPPVAYRGRHRWAQTIRNTPIEKPEISLEDGPFRPGGVYLITGGLGGIGLSLAEAIAPLRLKLVLLGRSALPQQSDFDTWLATHAEDEPVAQKIRSIRAIENAGTQVLTFAADVADELQMRDVIARIEQLFGRINGIVHGAGNTEHDQLQPIETLSLATCESHFRPKVRGLMVLEALFRDKQPEFFLLFSSLASILGGIRMSAYVAANAFMDAFAHAKSAAQSTRWVSVNLGEWLTDALKRSLLAKDTPFRAERTLLAMAPDEGVRALQLIMTRFREPQVGMSTRPVDRRSTQWSGVVPHDTVKTPVPTKTSVHSRSELLGRYEPPRTPTEQGIVDIWQDLLGVSPIGAYDDFWALGGHSLLGTQMLGRIRQQFQVGIALQDLFREPTVAGLSALIDVATRRAPPPVASESADDEIEEGTL